MHIANILIQISIGLLAIISLVSAITIIAIKTTKNNNSHEMIFLGKLENDEVPINQIIKYIKLTNSIDD